MFARVSNYCTCGLEESARFLIGDLLHCRLDMLRIMISLKIIFKVQIQKSLQDKASLDKNYTITTDKHKSS